MIDTHANLKPINPFNFHTIDYFPISFGYSVTSCVSVIQLWVVLYNLWSSFYIITALDSEINATLNAKNKCLSVPAIAGEASYDMGIESDDIEVSDTVMVIWEIM